MDLQLSKFAISQYIKKLVKNIFEKNLLNSTVLLLKVIYSMENPQSSYYSGSYGDTAVKILHDTVHQKVSEQHI